MTKSRTSTEITDWSWNDVHGEDTVRCLRQGEFACAIVADGVSLSAGGGNASKFAVDQVAKAFNSCYAAPELARADFQSFIEDLMYAMASAGLHEELSGSQTTLTIVVIEEVATDLGHRRYLPVEFFCSGDSPIVVCRKQELMSGFTDSFVCAFIHERPIVNEGPGRLYSFFDATSGTFHGSMHIGKFYLEEGETCLLMTDGVPYESAIVRDVTGDEKFNFLNLIKNGKQKKAFTWLKNYVKNHPLSDDASIVAIHHR